MSDAIDKIHPCILFRFCLVRKDLTDYYDIDRFHSINKFCYDNGFYDYGQYLKFEIRKTIRMNNKRFTIT